MAYFHLKLLPPRATFPFDATAAETEAMVAHAHYWQEQANVGAAIAVGPVFDPEGAFGMALVEIEDKESAQALADADPIVAMGLGFRYSLSPVPSLILRA